MASLHAAGLDGVTWDTETESNIHDNLNDDLEFGTTTGEPSADLIRKWNDNTISIKRFSAIERQQVMSNIKHTVDGVHPTFRQYFNNQPPKNDLIEFFKNNDNRYFKFIALSDKRSESGRIVK